MGRQIGDVEKIPMYHPAYAGSTNNSVPMLKVYSCSSTVTGKSTPPMVSSFFGFGKKGQETSKIKKMKIKRSDFVYFI